MKKTKRQGRIAKNKGLPKDLFTKRHERLKRHTALYGAVALAIAIWHSPQALAVCPGTVVNGETVGAPCFPFGAVANQVTIQPTGAINVPFNGFTDTAIFFSTITPVSNGTITNQGSITAVVRGINITAPTTGVNTINNSGSIIATSTLTPTVVGIFVNATDSTVINNSGSIGVGGAGNGIGINLFGGTSNSIITNSGSIAAGFAGISLSDGSNNVITNTGTGTISGIFGVQLNGMADSNTIDNAGMISAFTSGIGVQLNTSGNVLTNSGSISALGAGVGVDINSGTSNNTLTNSGTVSSGFGGLRVGRFGVGSSSGVNIFNSGLIELNSNADPNIFRSAVSLFGDFDGEMKNTGTIHVTDSFAGTLDVSDLVANGVASVFISQLSGTVENDGSITATTANINRHINGVVISDYVSGGSFINRGTISTSAPANSHGGQTGLAITSFDSGVTLTNAGSINSVFIEGGRGDNIFNLTGTGEIGTFTGDGIANTLNISGTTRLPDITSGFTSVTSSNRTEIILGELRSANNNTSPVEAIVTGALSLGEDNFLNVKVNSDGTSDRLLVTGAANVPASTNVKVDVSANTLSEGQSFHIIDGGAESNIQLSDENKVIDNSERYNFQPVVINDLLNNGQDLLLRTIDITRGLDSDSLGFFNILSAANLTSVDSELSLSLNSLTDQQLEQAFKQLRPEQNRGSLTAASAASRGALNVINSRLANLNTSSVTGINATSIFNNIKTVSYYNEATADSFSSSQDNGRDVDFWVQGFGSTIDQDRFQGVTGFDVDTYGVMFGADTLVLNNNTRLGFAFSYVNAYVDADDASFASDIDTYQGSIYADYSAGPGPFFNFTLSYAKNDYSQSRRVEIGFVVRNPNANYDGEQWVLQANYGMDIDYGNGIILSPSIGMYYSRLDTDAYVETGGGGANLTIDSGSSEIVESVIGISARKEYRLANGAVVVPEIRASWRHDFADERQLTTSRFTAGGATFSTQSVNPANDTFNIGAGLTTYLTDNINIGARYDYEGKTAFKGYSGLLNIHVKSKDLLGAFLGPIMMDSKQDQEFDEFDLAKLSQLDGEKESSSSLGFISDIDDYRYANLRIRGRLLDSSNLNYYVADGLSSVSVYLGNTPVHTNTGPGDFDHINYFERLDVSTAELLNGANNTLYGNTALSGIVRYLPNKPVLGDTSGNFGFAFNSLNSSEDKLGYSGDFTLNLPIGDYLAARFTGGRIKTEGSTEYRNLYRLDDNGAPIDPTRSRNMDDFFSKDDVNEFVSAFGRASLLWKPGHKLETLLIFSYQNDKRGGQRETTQGTDGFGNNYDFNQSGSLIVEPREREASTGSLNINLELDQFTVNSNTSLYKHNGSFIDDVTGVAANNFFLISSLDFCENTPGVVAGVLASGEASCFATPYELFSPAPLVVSTNEFEDEGLTQEVRLKSSEGDKVNYVAGLYFHDREREKRKHIDKPGFQDAYQANPFPYLLNPTSLINSDRWVATTDKLETTEIAAYGNLSYQLNEQFRLGLGLRLFNHQSDTLIERSYPMFNQASLVGLQFLADTPETLRFASITDEHETEKTGVLPSLQLQYQFTEQEQLYFNFDKGFRAGGLNSNAIRSTNNVLGDSLFRTFKYETSYNFSLGSRGTHIFKIGDYSSTIRYDLSLFSRIADDLQTPTFSFARDTRAQLLGAVFINADEAQQHGLELKATGNITSRWGAGIDYTFIHTAELNSDIILPNSVVSQSTRTSTLFASDGNRLPFTPKHALVLKSNYLIPYDSFSVKLFGSAFFQSKMKLSLDDVLANNDIASFATLNLGATFIWGNMNLTLWANNVTNVKGSLFGESAASGADLTQNYFGSNQTQSIALPRLIGATFSYQF